MFRRMRITQLSEADLSPYQLMRFAGHEDVGTTMTYVHIEEDEVREAVRARPVFEAPNGQMNQNNVDNLRLCLAKRLAAGEVSEESFNVALASLVSIKEERVG